MSDRITRNAGYFLVRFKEQCSEFLNTRAAGDYEAAMKAIIEIIEREQNALFKKEEASKRDEYGSGHK